MDKQEYAFFTEMSERREREKRIMTEQITSKLRSRNCIEVFEVFEGFEGFEL